MNNIADLWNDEWKKRFTTTSALSPEFTTQMINDALAALNLDWGSGSAYGEDPNRPKGISDEDYANFKKIGDPLPKKLKRKDYEPQIHTDSAKENPYWVKFSRTNNTLFYGRHRHPKR